MTNITRRGLFGVIGGAIAWLSGAGKASLEPGTGFTSVAKVTNIQRPRPRYLRCRIAAIPANSIGDDFKKYMAREVWEESDSPNGPWEIVKEEC